MKVTILGAGTAIPSLDYSPASILLQSGTADALIDFGPGALQKAAQAGIDYINLDTVFLTHLHSDHTLDLITFLQANDSNPTEKRTTPLQVYGCVGTKAWYKKLMEAFPGISPSTYSFAIAEMKQYVWTWRELQVSSILTGHTETSLAYRFEGNEGSFVFTGDAVLSNDLFEFCANADLLICECSFPSGWVSQDHMTADKVGLLAKTAAVKHIAVTHQYSPALAVDIFSQIAESYSGKITIAKDGSSFAIEKGIK